MIADHTPDRLQSKKLLIIDEHNQKSIETVFSIAVASQGTKPFIPSRGTKPIVASQVTIGNERLFLMIFDRIRR